MKKFMPVFMAIGISLALLFTFSCSSDGDNSGTNSSSSSANESSSSNGDSSSSTTDGSPSSSSLTVLSSSSSAISSSSNVELSSSSQQQSSSSNAYIGTGGKGNNIGSYKTKQIGTQIWMAENLNYDVFGSRCYDDLESNCDIYGRLYDWATAMALPLSCNTSACDLQVSAKHRGICPEGWHIPSNSEWRPLETAVGGFSTAGTKLKATSGWNDYDGQSCNGTDDYGFSALPGGYGYYLLNGSNKFINAGYLARWWTSSEWDGNEQWAEQKANYRRIEWYFEQTDYHSDYKDYLYSVRCLKD